MEGYARHSRSHLKAAPLPPSSAVAGAGNGTGFYKKQYSNGAGGNALMAYDDVFGGAPKFGATPFAPRAEDYSEIFGSFRSSRTSSIPMLDLPPVDDSVDAFEVLGCSSLEYTEIFGGFDFADFAASYDELFRRSEGSEESSDDAWTPVGTESPSEASDPYASSGRNQYFLNGDFNETLEDNMFDVSHHNVKLGIAEDTELTDEAHLSSVPGYTYLAEGSTMSKEDEERYSSAVADDIILCEDSSGNISVETRWNTAAIRSHSGAVKQSRDYDEPSHLPPPSKLSHSSKLPPTVVERKKDPAETIFESSSLDFFDVEFNAASSSIAAAAAMQEAMNRAKLKINSAQALRRREKDGVEDMAFINNDLNRDGKVKMVFRDSIQDTSEASLVLPDPLQPEDAVNRVAESAQRKTAKNQSSSLDPDFTDGDGEWKVRTECYELLNNCNSKTEPTLPEPQNIKKPVQEMTNCDFGNANGRAMSFKQTEQNVEGIAAAIKEHEDSKSAEEACDPRENRPRLRATKGASRNAFHEQMLKLAQDVHKTVINDRVEDKRGKEGLEGDGADRSPEMGFVGEKNEGTFDQAAQQVHYVRKYEEESYLAETEIGSEEDLVQADFDKTGKEDCKLQESDRRGTEVAAREETVKRVKVVAERGNNGRGLNDHQNGEQEVGSAQEGAETMKKVMSPRNENPSRLNEVLEQKEDNGKSGRNEKQSSDVNLKRADQESMESENEIFEKEIHKTDQFEKNAEEAAVSGCYDKILRESVDLRNCGKADVATENIRTEERINAADDHRRKSKRLEMSNGTCKNEDGINVSEKEEMEKPVQASESEKSQKLYECSTMNEELKMENKGDLQSESKVTDQDSNEKSNLHLESECITSISTTLDDEVLEVARECEELTSSNSPSSFDEEDIKSFSMTCEGEEKLENYVVEEKDDFCSGASNFEMESNVFEIPDIYMPTRYPQKAETGQPMLSEKKESVQKQYPSSDINQRVDKEEKAVNGNCGAEDREMAEKLKRKEESERELLRAIQLESERERERELEKERLRKLEEEREKELEKLRLKRLEELREREREKDLERDHLRKLEEERQREREKDLEKERLRKLEEEWEREREREKDRMGVELKMSAAHERAAVERATAEARQRAMAEARERLEKACAEAREKSIGKPSKDAQLRAERAAVERATAEARERAIERAMTRERVERSVSEKFSSSFREVELRHCSSSNDLWNPDKSDGVEGESAQRCKARLDRHRRTVERVAKALAEKNTRDLIAQREQAERNRLAETLDADIKRWSNGKEGNLRALLSTLQYILGSDSGWQPIPLTEVITSAAVKKAYRKATLCVHPDKLQQRGATIQQKYICEKVFDLLKDGWNRFNSEER